MEIVIDLSGLVNEYDITKYFSEILDFGKHNDGSLVGLNSWDAFNDCLNYLDSGGIFGTSKKIIFPCTFVITGYSDFQKNDPNGFQIFKEILEEKQTMYQEYDMSFRVIYK